jgi:hypothetical protein
MSYDRARAPSTSAWFLRRRPRNDTAFRPALAYKLSLPVGGVRLHGGIIGEAFEGEVQYLLSHFRVQDILYHFRDRANGAKRGAAAAVSPSSCPPNSADAKSFGWDGGLQGETDRGFRGLT